MVSFSRFHQGIDNRAAFRAVRGVGEQPVLAARDKGADGVLHLVVADFYLAVFQEGAEVGLLV